MKKTHTNRDYLSIPQSYNEVLTVGLDLGDRRSHYCVLNSTGEVISEGSLSSNPTAFRAHFSGVKRCRIALEVGAHSRWVSSLLRELSFEVIVANASQVHLISESSRKTDKVDARTLAKLARVDPSLLWPIHHRNAAAQSRLCVIRARHAVVAARTQLINCVRGMVKSFGERLPACSADSFSDRIKSLIPEALRPALEPLRKQIALLTEQIRTYEKQIEHTADEEYPETVALRTVPGIGALTALTFVLTLEDAGRFRKSRDVGCYLGLKPKQSQSGQCSPQLGISKAGDCYLRKLLVGSAQYILGPFGPDTDLRRWGLELAKRGGPNAKKRAIVAVARKLAVLLHRLWVDQKQYEPFRQALQSVA
jgi:transposase